MKNNLTIQEYTQLIYDLRISPTVAGLTDLENIPLFVIKGISPVAGGINDLDTIQIRDLFRIIQRAYRHCQTETNDRIPRKLGMGSTSDDYQAALLNVVLSRCRGVSNHDICVGKCIFDT